MKKYIYRIGVCAVGISLAMCSALIEPALWNHLIRTIGVIEETYTECMHGANSIRSMEKNKESADVMTDIMKDLHHIYMANQNVNYLAYLLENNILSYKNVRKTCKKIRSHIQSLHICQRTDLYKDMHICIKKYNRSKMPRENIVFLLEHCMFIEFAVKRLLSKEQEFFLENPWQRRKKYAVTQKLVNICQKAKQKTLQCACS
ncbi:uncharacterized protein NEMAJ01_0537 [Nematocida major]|uniref:uncharacterized protein n=1 Tax=Nematocida major TaxID=1912982 RepID=UPI0020081138|nr:uncharacterized protein NEMAJ01_0537 [Nematocida major]KAH9385641.1 hypothetical protein NEMAJ01_0537 [Nematocida major]